ncbi:hypothetical protein APHAL10511_006599 [Amanita phalloides]|nr:hypothetical protein APHAL10511_006599 [Amanita phalloides]
MPKQKKKKYRCHAPNCDASFSSSTALNNHQCSCGQDLTSVLTIRIKKYKIQAVLNKKNRAPTDVPEPSNHVHDAGEDMQVDPPYAGLGAVTGGPSQSSCGNLEMTPRHSGHLRRLPARFRDVLPPPPPQPDREPQPGAQINATTSAPMATSIEALVSTSTHVPLNVYDTKPNAFNIF